MRLLLVVATALLAAACAPSGTVSTGAAPESTPASSTQTSPSEVTPPPPTSEAPPPQLAPAPIVGVAGTPCDVANGACIQLSTAQTWLVANGVVTHGPFPITSGRPGHETPTGTFPVAYKVRHEVSREFDNAPMPYSVYFAPGGIAFHEGSLTELSHGCIHLSQEAAALYFDTLTPSDSVQVVT